MMLGEKLIKNYLNNNNGYITTKQIEELGISRVHITKYIEQGIIRRIGRGLYVAKNYIEDEYYNYQIRRSNTIFSHNTAFHLLGISERTPFKMDITTYSGNNVSGNDDIIAHYISKPKLHIGVIDVKTPYGNNVKVYNLERSICDMIRNRDEFDLELYNKIINNYFISGEKNLKRLLEYAKEFNISEKVNTIMEVIGR